MKKCLGIGALLVIPVIVAFYAAVFSTAFNTSLCYSDVLDKLTDKQAAAASGNSTQRAHHVRLMKSLPLAGYGSHCEQIRAVVDADLASQTRNKLQPANQ